MELARLHILRGIELSKQLQSITQRKEFQQIEGENNIFTAISEADEDYFALLSAARKAVEHGYRVFITDSPSLLSRPTTCCLI